MFIFITQVHLFFTMNSYNMFCIMNSLHLYNALLSWYNVRAWQFQNEKVAHNIVTTK